MDLKNKFSKLGICLASELQKKHISTSLKKLDKYLLGGFERKKITEIAGWERSGRTTLCLRAAQEAQKEGGIVAIVDTEDTFEIAQKYKLCTERTIFCPLHICKHLLEAKCIDLLVIDSIASVSYEKGYGSKFNFSNILAIYNELEQIFKLINKSNTACIITNQFRLSPNGGVYTYGEKKIEKLFSTRLFLNKIANRSKYYQDGLLLSIKIQKGKEFKGEELEIELVNQDTEISETIEKALSKGVIRYNGKYFIYKSYSIGKKSMIADFLIKNEEVFSKIKQEIKSSNLV